MLRPLEDTPAAAACTERASIVFEQNVCVQREPLVETLALANARMPSRQEQQQVKVNLEDRFGSRPAKATR
jgi:hypothetical protein